MRLSVDIHYEGDLTDEAYDAVVDDASELMYAMVGRVDGATWRARRVTATPVIHLLPKEDQ